MKMSVGDQNGFTLIETVLALSITAVLLIVVLSSLRLGISSWERGEALIERSSIKRNIFHRFEREAASAYPFRLKGKEGRIAFIGNGESAGFVTVASSVPSVIPGARFVYYVSGEEGIKVYEKYPTADDLLSFSGGELVETEPDAKGVSFEYLGNQGWSAEWQPRKDEFPRAVRVEVLLKDESKLYFTVPLGVKSYGQEKQQTG